MANLGGFILLSPRVYFFSYWDCRGAGLYEAELCATPHSLRGWGLKFKPLYTATEKHNRLYKVFRASGGSLKKIRLF
jgi:hypothetical protein